MTNRTKVTTLAVLGMLVVGVFLAIQPVFACMPCTPGFWKNHHDYWCGSNPDDLVSDVFTLPDDCGDVGDLGDATLDEALHFGGGKGVEGGARNLLRAAVAYMLNLECFDPSQLPDNIGLTNERLQSCDRHAMLDRAENLDDVLNEYECPDPCEPWPTCALPLPTDE